MDAFTLVVVSALVAGIMAASMLLLYRASSRQPCLLDWSLSGLCFLVSNVIGAIALQYPLDSVFAPAVANMFYIAGHAGILAGVRRHLALRPRYDLLVLVALAVLAAHAMSFTQGSVLHRLFLFTPVVACINLGIAWLLWRQPDGGTKPAYLPLMLLVLLFTAEAALRCVLEFMGSPAMQTVDTLSTLVFLSVATMACALIVTQQQELALRRASLTDVLTGWLNRRALHDIAGREFGRCRRTGMPLYFIAFDIDHFKAINDRYGHDTGDAAIVHVSTLAARAVRGYDAMFRIGGEEFAVLVGGGVLADVQGIAQRLRELVENTPLPTLALAPGLPVRMTVSVGVAAAQAGDTRWEDVLKRADEAMYHAKRQGRNRVSVHGIDLAAPHRGARLHVVAG